MLHIIELRAGICVGMDSGIMIGAPRAMKGTRLRDIFSAARSLSSLTVGHCLPNVYPAGSSFPLRTRILVNAWCVLPTITPSSHFNRRALQALLPFCVGRPLPRMTLVGKVSGKVGYQSCGNKHRTTTHVAVGGRAASMRGVVLLSFSSFNILTLFGALGMAICIIVGTWGTTRRNGKLYIHRWLRRSKLAHSRWTGLTRVFLTAPSR